MYVIIILKMKSKWGRKFFAIPFKVKLLNKSIDRYNHAIDALRYYTLLKFETEIKEEGYSDIIILS